MSDYRILEDHVSERLAAEVTELMKVGYLPLGGVQIVAPVVNESPAALYVQSMIREGDQSDFVGGQ